MQRFGLLGHPLTHSHSPKMMGLLARHHQWEMRYEPFDIDSGDLPGFVAGIRANRGGGTRDERDPPVSGFNVTVPHKQAILPFCDTLSPEVAAIGAANTITVHNSRLTAHNTDIAGFTQALRAFEPPQESVQSALILGAGGAARAAAYALAAGGCRRLAIAARTPAREDTWRSGFPDLFRSARVTFLPFDPAALADPARESRLIVQCTPVGTHPHGDRAVPFPFHSIRRQHFVIDMVYNPAQTAFMRAAAARGAQTQNGVVMLAAQAVASLRIWGYDTQYQVLEPLLISLLEN
jgi:shikimate dehydrogenase